MAVTTKCSAAVPHEAINESFEAFLARVHADDRARVEAWLAGAKRSEIAVNGTFRSIRPGGGIGWIEVYAKGYPGADRVSCRLVGVFKDITERRRREEQLRQAAVIYETATEGIAILDVTRRVVSINPAFTVLTGHTLEEVFGQDPERFLHARPHSNHFYSQLEGTAEEQRQGEIQCRRKNGEPFQVWETVSTVRDGNGKLTHYAIVFSDITAARKAEEQLHYLAHHDPLTGLPNRLLFNERLEHALERARRDRARCSLLFVDIDDFKDINDTLGHASGDALLQTVATRIQGIVRRSDTAARFGGDEFVVIAEEIAHGRYAARLAGKLLNAVSEPIELAGERIAVSASVGIGIYPHDGTNKLAAWGSKVSAPVALAQRSTFSAPAGVAAPVARITSAPKAD